MNELRTVVIALVLVAAMAMAVVMGRRARLGVVLLALLSVLWILVDKDFEGPTLIKLDSKHGLTVADLVGVLGLLVAGWLWRVNRRRDRRAARAPRRPRPGRSRRTPR